MKRLLTSVVKGIKKACEGRRRADSPRASLGVERLELRDVPASLRAGQALLQMFNDAAQMQRDVKAVIAHNSRLASSAVTADLRRLVLDTLNNRAGAAVNDVKHLVHDLQAQKKHSHLNLLGNSRVRHDPYVIETDVSNLQSAPLLDNIYSMLPPPLPFATGTTTSDNSIYGTGQTFGSYYFGGSQSVLQSLANDYLPSGPGSPPRPLRGVASGGACPRRLH
jgi:hypothetical protein